LYDTTRADTLTRKHKRELAELINDVKEEYILVIRLQRAFKIHVSR